MSEHDELISNLFSEMRRGAITLCVLSRLNEPRYGYALVETLEHSGMRIEPGTLYPLLRRLEKQGLLESEWVTSGSKPRKYYALSDMGRDVYCALTEEWRSLRQTIDGLTGRESE